MVTGPEWLGIPIDRNTIWVDGGGVGFGGDMLKLFLLKKVQISYAILLLTQQICI